MTTSVIEMKPATERELAILMNTAADLATRKSALAKLVALRDPEAVVPLAVLMTEIELALLQDLKGALAALGAAEVLAADLDRLPVDEKVRAVRLLGYLEDDAALPALLRALDDAEPRVRTQAADGLIRLRPAEVVGPLVDKMRGDPDPRVRMAAAQALGEIADETSLEALRRAMESEADGFVRVVLELSCHRAERICDDRAFWS